MIKKTNKKGFTLAELLIVVAIIAVLVAIAVPLFVGALDRAKEETFNSNQRAIKSIGATILLSDSTLDLTSESAPKTYYAYAKVSNGEIGTVNVTELENATEMTGGAKTYKDWKEGGLIIAEIKVTELGKYAAGTPAE